MKTLSQLTEAVEKHHVTAFTRMNPPTTGHMQLIDKVHAVAKEHGADHSVVVSHSQDPKKNPLSSDQKKKHLKRFSPETNVIASSKEHPTVLHHLAALHKAGVTHLHLVAGSDRHDEMHKLTNAYNGKKSGHGYYKFKKISIHSAGERDPDAEGTSGVSATKQREHAASGNFKEFRKGVPSHVSDEHTKDLMNDVKNGQKTKKNEESEMESLDNLFEEFMIEDSESFSDAELWNVVDQTSFSDLDPNENDSDFIETLVGESIEEDLDESRVLSILQRQRAKMKFKQRQPRMKRMRELKRKRMATPQRLTYRARTSALMMLRKRIAGQKGLSYHKLPPSQRYAIDKAVHARYGKNLDKLVGTLSKRTLPMIRKKEMARLAKARGQKTSSIIGQQVMTQSYDVREDSDYISTNKDHLLTPKVNMLLRLGLVDQDEIERYRRALKIGEKALSSPELRGKILSMLDKTLKLATDDPQTFARIRAMVVLKRNSQNEQNSLEVNPLEIDPLEIDKMDPTPDEGHSRHLTLRKKMIRQHESKTFASLREKIKGQYDPLAEDKIAESLYNKSVKYNVSIDTVVEVYEDALRNSGNENVAFDAVNSFLANRELDEVQRSADVNRVKVRLPDGRIVWRNDRREVSVQDEEVVESHFKIGDKIKFKTSGMKGEVVKLDKEDGAEDEKYYTIKGEDGKMQKMAPKDMIKETEQIDEKHLVNVTISDPNHTMVSKRKETMQRRASVTAKDREHAIDIAINHYKKQGYKVHDHQYIEKKEKDFENTSPAPKVSKTSLYRDVKEEVDADSIFEIEMYVPEIHEARGDHLLTIQGGRGKGRKFAHKDTSTDDHLSAMEFHLKGYHDSKKDKLEATKNHHAKMYHKHKDQIEALGGVGNHLKESRGHKILAQKIQQIAIRKRMNADALARHNAEKEKAEKEKKQGVVEASNTKQRYGQLILKRAKAKREAEANKEKPQTSTDTSSTSTRDLLQQLRRPNTKKKRVSEEGGAGEFGTPELTKKYAKDTPGQCQEILNMNTSDMGDVIKDFKKSDAPQFKGKSIEKRRQMAIAAKLSSQDKEQ